jgi:hypothetical protein
MTGCKQIQEMLSAFLEGVLSPDEERLVLQHLATCRQCSAVLEDLKKVAQLVQGLDDVEPPPWFTQKVMSQIREEAERKKRGLIARLFYPLHVKVPIQALASVLIVVLALYVYRSVEPEMEVVQAPSPVAPRNLAAPKNGLQRPYDKAGAARSTAKNEPAPEQLREKAAGTIAEAPRTEVAQKPAREEAHPAVSLPAEAARAEKQETLADRQAQEMKAAAPSPGQQEAPQVHVQVQKAHPPALARREAESTVSAEADATMKEARDNSGTQAASRMQAFAAKKAELTGFTLRVNDVTAAAGEIKSLLSQLGARGIAAESRDGTAVITAELAVQRMEELSKKLRTLGQVEEKGPRPVTMEGYVSIRIEVTS